MNALDGLVDNLLTASAASGPVPFAVGTVASFTDNGVNPPTVTVTWRGSKVVAACPRHYTPVVGHVVVMARFGPQLNIIGAY